VLTIWHAYSNGTLRTKSQLSVAKKRLDAFQKAYSSRVEDAVRTDTERAKRLAFEVLKGVDLMIQLQKQILEATRYDVSLLTASPTRCLLIRSIQTRLHRLPPDPPSPRNKCHKTESRCCPSIRK